MLTTNLAGDLPKPRRTESIASAIPHESARILMLSIVNPQVEYNGAATVTRGLLKLLASPPFEARVDCVPVRAEPLRWRRLAQARSLLLSSVSILPAKAAFCYSKEFREDVVARVESEHYDLVLLNGADLLWVSDYLPASIPRVLIAHNIEHLLFRAQIQNLGWWYRPVAGMLRKDCTRLQDYELKGIREIGKVIFLSREEAAYAGSLCECLRSTTIPPVFDYEPRPRPHTIAGPTLEIGLLGNFKWWPNQLSLRWFSNEVLPYVKSPVRVNLFGHSGVHPGRGDPRIVKRGVVESLEQVWASCDFMICPAFSTGGVCVKFAEAVYNKMPVLATRHAARGFSVGHDPALVFLNEPREWVEFLNSKAARDLAERQVSDKTAARFAMDVQKDKFQQFVKNAIACHAALGTSA